MRKLTLLLLAIAGCFLLANAMVNDSGYVLIAYDNITFESSLWAVLLLIAVFFCCTWLGITFLKIAMGASTSIYPWSNASKAKKAQRLSLKGLAEFSHGHWKKAERYLAQAAECGEAPLINYLAAARAAHESGNHDACSEYLRRADHKAPGAEIAVGVTQAQLQLSGGQLEQALATLTHLHKKVPSHAYVLKLLKQVYTRLNDWQALATLLPTLKKYKVIDDIQYREIETQAFGELFEQAYKQGTSHHQPEQRMRPANDVWHSLNTQQRRNNTMLFRYAQTLARLGSDEKAEQMLRGNLSKNYSADLITLYGVVKGKIPKKQLLTAETLLNERPNDPALLMTLGRLAMRNQLWGKAREYLEASLRLKKNVDVYNELGCLLAHLDDHEKSSYYFREGLTLATESKTQLAL